MKLGSLRDTFGAEIDAIDDSLRAYLSERDDPTAHYAMIRYHFGFGTDGSRLPSGKRIRPMFCLLIGRATGVAESPLRTLMLASELMHGASLVHDDIEDGDAKRWNRATVWSRFGKSQAINVGDAMIGMTYELLHRLRHEGVRDDVVLRVLQIYNETHLRMTEGQHLDLAHECRPDTPVDVYLGIVGRKTAIACECPARAAVVLANGADHLEDSFARFGRAFGMLYQIVDDIGSVWGEPDTTGKAALGDLVRRSASLPVLYGFQHGSRELRELLLPAVSSSVSERLTPEQAARVRDELERLPVLELCRELAVRYRDEALTHLRATGIASAELAMLETMTRLCCARTDEIRRIAPGVNQPTEPRPRRARALAWYRCTSEAPSRDRDARRPDPVLTSATVDEAIEDARLDLASLQRADGSWSAVNYMGPLATGLILVFKRYIGALDDEAAREAVRFLQDHQRPDGSFQRYPFAPQGNLDCTLTCYAGLVAAGVDEAAPVVAKAKQYLDEHDGFREVPLRTALTLSMAGLRDPELLPALPLIQKLIPGFERFAIKWLASWTLLVLNMTAGLARGLKDRGTPTSWLRHPLRRLEAEQVIRYLSDRQSPTGDWFGQLLYTILGAAALHSLGVPASDPRIQRAVRYVDERLTHQAPDGRYGAPFSSEIWDTGCSVNALLEAGTSPDDPRIRAAIEFLLAQQSERPMPKDWQGAKHDTPRSGGWPFEVGNELAVDTDDTALVLAVLKNYSVATGSDPIAQARLAKSIERAMRRGLAWLLAMQNADGGWPIWTHGHRAKKPGPLEIPSLLARRNKYAAYVSDPSVEGMTARIIATLSLYGYTAADPEIQRAIAYLKAQQLPDGTWWGRWFVNYLPTTATVVSGLSAVGEDMSAGYVRRALDWIRERQNSDGGWGETARSYDEPSLAGRADSSPTITAVAIEALIDAGEARSDAVARGVRWLLRERGDAGAWEDVHAQSCILPAMQLFFHNELFPKHYPLHALARYRRALASPEASVAGVTRRSDR